MVETETNASAAAAQVAKVAAAGKAGAAAAVKREPSALDKPTQELVCKY